MPEPTYFEDLLEIIRPYLPEDATQADIRPESRFMEDLNINSSHLVDIVLDVEDRFDIRLEDADMEVMRSVGDAIRLVQSKVKDTGPRPS